VVIRRRPVGSGGNSVKEITAAGSKVGQRP
jgi:hypothetical protein